MSQPIHPSVYLRESGWLPHRYSAAEWCWKKNGWYLSREDAVKVQIALGVYKLKERILASPEYIAGIQWIVWGSSEAAV